MRPRGRLIDAIAVFAALGLAGLAALSPWPIASIPAALLVSASFAVAAWLLRGVDISGAIAGTGAAFVFYRLGGWRLFAVLLFVFVLTLAATKVSSRREAGGRSASQVTANLVVSMVVLLYPGAGTYTVALAVLSELAADTVSSEIGEAFGGEPRLISTMRKTLSGANGGITLVGTAAGVTAALLVTISACALQLRGFHLWVPIVSGVVGMLADSLFGATLENRGWLNNDAVNLLGTACSAAVAFGLFRLLVRAPL